MRARSALAVPSSSTPRHVSFIAEGRNFKPESRAPDPWPSGLGRWPLRGFQVHGKPEPFEGGTAVARTDTSLMPDISEAETARGYLGSVLRLTVDFLERSEEHTSELQSPCNLVCRLLLEKKKKNTSH